VSAYVKRADAFGRQDRWARAVEDMTIALALKPDDANLYLLRAQTRQRQDDLDGAMDDLERALAAAHSPLKETVEQTLEQLRLRKVPAAGQPAP
jgi:tetratricopeptide (TPR) repeat protein